MGTLLVHARALLSCYHVLVSIVIIVCIFRTVRYVLVVCTTYEHFLKLTVLVNAFFRFRFAFRVFCHFFMCCLLLLLGLVSSVGY